MLSESEQVNPEKVPFEVHLTSIIQIYHKVFRVFLIDRKRLNETLVCLGLFLKNYARIFTIMDLTKNNHASGETPYSGWT